MSNAKVVGKITQKLKVCGSVKYSTGGGVQSNFVLPKTAVMKTVIPMQIIDSKIEVTITEV